MGAQFNIKNAEVRELAGKVAQHMGVDLTEAVRLSLKAHLKFLTREERIARVEAILDGIKPRLSREFLEMDDPTAILYDDETGLPV